MRCIFKNLTYIKNLTCQLFKKLTCQQPKLIHILSKRKGKQWPTNETTIMQKSRNFAAYAQLVNFDFSPRYFANLVFFQKRTNLTRLPHSFLKFQNQDHSIVYNRIIYAMFFLFCCPINSRC